MRCASLSLAAALLCALIVAGCERARRGEVATPTVSEPAGAVLVDDIATGSPLLGAGLAVGDRLISWRRGVEGGPIDSWDDLARLEIEQAPLGAVEIEVERDGTRHVVRLTEDRWRVRSRPALAPEASGLVRAAFGPAQPEAARAAHERLEPLLRAAGDRAWLAWRWADVPTHPPEESAAAWQRALDAARATNDPALEGWVAAEACSVQTRRASFGEASAACGRSLELAEARGAGLAAAQARFLMANLAGRRGEPAEEARRSSELLADLSPPADESLLAVRALRGLARAHASQGDSKQALAIAERARALVERRAPRSLEHMATTMSTGIFLWFLEDWDAAETRFTQALAMLEAIDPEHAERANLLGNLAMVANDRGDLARAEELFLRSLAARAVEIAEPIQESRTLNNLAIVAARRADFASAVAYDRRVLEIRERLTPDSLDLATPLLNLGEHLRRSGDLSGAASAIERALAIQRRHHAGGALEAGAQVALGEVQVESHDASAADTLSEALEVASRDAPDSVVEASAALALGRLRFDRGELVVAEPLLRRAVRIFSRRKPGTSEQAAALHALATLLRSTGRADEALDALFEAAAALDRQFGVLGGSDETRARFGEAWRPIYRDLAAMLRERGRVDEAFEVLERGRTRAFLHLLRERRLDARLAARPSHDASLDRELGLPALRAALGDSVTAISYETDALSTRAWLIRPGEPVEFVDLGVAEPELRDLVQRFRWLLESRSNAADPGPLATKLHSVLVAPLASRVETPSVLIVPDGPLHQLPFAALRESGARPRYLVEWKPLQVAASVTAWAELRRRPASRWQSASAFGDPSPSPSRLAGARGTAPWARLSFGRREATLVAGLQGAGGRAFVGTAATEAMAKQAGRDSGMLHFATHAYVDPRSPLDSALVLAPSDPPGSRREDGLLEAWEIFQEIELDAELVVLSGCDTGGGSQVADEGILGLTRAFQLAGARAVLASFWPISDRDTGQFMEVFHRELASGSSADRALQAAQLRALASAEGSHPSRWAAFQLYGAPHG